MKKFIVLISLFLSFFSFSKIAGQLSDDIKYLNSDSTITLYPDSNDSGMLWYDNKELGLKIKFDRWEETSLKYPAYTSSWLSYESKLFGIRFRHPPELEIRFIKTEGNNHGLDSDSTLQLGYAVEIYTSKRSFEEIANSEGFFKESEVRGNHTSSEKWLIHGKSYDPAYLFDGKQWSGIRGETTRGGGISMGQIPWRASFLRSKADDENRIIISFYYDPLSEKPRNQRMSENDFYEFVSSIEVIK